MAQLQQNREMCAKSLPPCNLGCEVKHAARDIISTSVASARTLADLGFSKRKAVHRLYGILLACGTARCRVDRQFLLTGAMLQKAQDLEHVLQGTPAAHVVS